MKLRSWVLFAALGAGLAGCALAQEPRLKISSGPFTKNSTSEAADLSVRSASFPASLTVGTTYAVRVTTYLGSQPLDKPYTVSIYRAAYSKEGLLLMENVLVGSARVWPHNPNTYRTTNVPITLSVLKKGRRGMQEAFSTRSVFTVKAEAAEPEENVSNNQLTREVPVTH